MNIYLIDQIAVTGKSWLHRLPAWSKLLALVAIIAVALAMPRIPVLTGLLALVLVLALSARLPFAVLLPLTLYPVLFLAILFFSVRDLTLAAGLVVGLRVLAITASVIVLLLTTSYPAIFDALGHVLPAVLVAALFFTYRSLFILATSFTDLRTAMHLRGGVSWRHPIKTLRNLGMALAHLLVHAIETSERVADSLRIRGFRNRIYSSVRK